jgi:imidazolonepropionase-like amidohydrolase
VDRPSYHIRATLLPHGDQAVDLWVTGGRISFRPPAAAEPLAPSGGYVLAGLVDCHAHLTMDPGRKGLPAGCTELVEANRRDQLAAGALLLRDIGALSDATLRLPGGEPLPRVVPAGRFLAPAGGYTGIQQATAATELAMVAADQVRRGARWSKIVADWPRERADGALPALERGVTNYPAEAIRAAVDAVHAAGGRIAVHAMTHNAIAAAVEGGVDCVEHGTAMDGDLLAHMAEHGIGWTPTLASLQATRRSAGRRGQETLASWLDECFERLRTLLPRARALGIPVLAGTDVLPHGSIAREVVALRESPTWSRAHRPISSFTTPTRATTRRSCRSLRSSCWAAGSCFARASSRAPHMSITSVDQPKPRAPPGSPLTGS